MKLRKIISRPKDDPSLSSSDTNIDLSAELITPKRGLFSFSRWKNQRKGRSGTVKTDVPLLTGVEAFITLDALNGGDQVQSLVNVVKRKASLPIKKSYYGRNVKDLNIYIDRDIKDKYGKVRLAADAYLKLGLLRSLKTKGRPLVLLGGDDAELGVNVEVLVFRNGELTDVIENSLPGTGSLDFDDMLDTLISNLRSRYEGCVIEQCANLPRWDRVEISHYHDYGIFKSAKPINLHSKQSNLLTYGLPAIFLVGGGLFYAWTIHSGFTAHDRLVKEARDLEVQMSYLTDERVTIEIMEAREAFKKRQIGTEPQYVTHVRDIAQTVSSLKGAEISSVRSPGGEPGIAAQLSMSVERDNSPSALEQARHILDDLVSKSNNYSMRLSRTQAIAAQGNRVLFHIEVIDE